MENRKKVSNKNIRRYFDLKLLITVILLFAYGLLMLYSTTSITAIREDIGEFYYIKRQFFLGGIGLVLCVLTGLYFNYKLLKNKILVYSLYVISIIIFILVLSPIGIESHGARRWIGFAGISLQVAEPAKLAFILLLAYYFSNDKYNFFTKEKKKIILKNGKTVIEIKKKYNLKSIFTVCLSLGILLFLAYGVTSNLSSTIIFFCMFYIMLSIRCEKYKKIQIIFLSLGLLVLVMAYIYGHNLAGLGFRGERIRAWSDPDNNSSGYAYQTMQALYAIGTCGLFGSGLGNSIQKLGAIPEAHNDMIFAIICEETGLFGVIILLLLYGYLLYRILFISKFVKDRFGFYILVGVFAHLFLQTIINLAVVTNLFPNTGVTLPFISYGGSSIILLMLEIGIVLNISRSIEYDNKKIVAEIRMKKVS